MKQTIGLIGLGAMGGAMAQRLLAAGFDLSAWARSPDKAKHLQASGLQLLPSPAALFDRSSILLTNLTTTTDVESVLLGPQGALAHLKSGSLVIDFSTTDAGVTQKIAAAFKTKKIGFLDAPVSGGQARAQAGTLSIMVGGEAADLTRAQALLEVLGKSITHVGANGSGQVMKACNQMVMCSTLLGIAEAVVYAKHFHADITTLVSVLGAGLAGSEVLNWAGPKMANDDTSATIAARLHEKDLRMVGNTLTAEQLHLPLTALTSQRLTELIASGGGDKDTSAVLGIVEKHSKGH
ncbi:MAG: NAD(P)-dependent oxidoreductase [Burkholderiales bacterium]|nr:NAD(P)-dependent oxidoreductase [Burkholderiales bacterium]